MALGGLGSGVFCRFGSWFSFWGENYNDGSDYSCKREKLSRGLALSVELTFINSKTSGSMEFGHSVNS